MNDLYVPVTHSQVALSALTRMLNTAYTWKTEVRVTLLRSWTNDVYEVSSGDEHYILKVYRATWRSPLQVEWEVEMQQWLSEHGAPVAPPVSLVSGPLFGLLHAPEGTRCFALFRHAPGTKPSPPWTTGLYHDYGRGAALIHEASSGFPAPDSALERTLVNLIDESLVIITSWLEDRPGDLRTVRQVASIASQHLVPVLPTLDWGICHGDLSLDNLHVQPDDHLTVYDFDATCFGWRAWDVCNALGYATPEHQDAFLRGYRSVRPFSREELMTVPYFIAADVLRMMAGEVSRWSEWFGTERVDAWVNDKLAWLRSWKQAHAS